MARASADAGGTPDSRGPSDGAGIPGVSSNRGTTSIQRTFRTPTPFFANSDAEFYFPQNVHVDKEVVGNMICFLLCVDRLTGWTVAKPSLKLGFAGDTAAQLVIEGSWGSWVSQH